MSISFCGRIQNKITRVWEGLVRSVAVRRIRAILTLTEAPCLMCGCQEFLALRPTDKYGLPVPTVRCRTCGFIQERPRPTNAFLARFYGTSLYRRLVDGRLGPNKTSLQKARLHAEQNLAYLEELARRGVMVSLSLSALNVGDADGTFLRLLKRRFPNARTYGIDPGLVYWKKVPDDLDGTFAELSHVPPGQTFDLITLWHVFEHLTDPDATLQEIGKKLSSNGVLVIEVPDAAKYEGESPYTIAHLWHFDRKSLTAILERNGYVVVEMQDVLLRLLPCLRVLARPSASKK